MDTVLDNDFPVLVDILSAEIFDMPGNKASVAFIPKTTDVFRESADITTTQIDGKEIVCWGATNNMPYEIIKLIEADETLATCQEFNSEVCYGAGLEYCTDDASEDVRADVDEFMDNNPMPDYYLGVSKDFKYFNFAVSVIILNKKGDKIVELHRKHACYCRFSPASKSGRIEKVYYANFRNMAPDDKLEEITLLDVRSPLADLRRRIASGEKKHKYAILTRLPGIDSLYYPIPHYAALFKGPWYKIKAFIGVAKLAKLSNAAPVKYVIEISSSYWPNFFKEKHAVTAEDQQKVVDERKREMLKFLTDATNSGSVLFTGKSISLDGKSETPDITVTPIDSKTKEGGDWASDIAEAVNMECFTMRVHSNLVGSVPGKAQTNNSGSDKRELYTIAQALQKPYHDVLFNVHKLIIKFNGWKGVHPVCPFVQLTTLDEHRDSKKVTVKSADDADD